ncbi:hypothetical protein KPL71_014410 [Citrus sinensis]|uniref:Uncharacterized protein n=1 Tax=Citrus sinensis TaxID=2711 RepID=A0ACB8KBQ1_CITSI|nr:hypothetical protein KPL71_014410 [Citrus sinensis]
MVDAIVSSLLEQLISVAADEVKQQVRLVTGVREEVKKLTSNLQAIQLVLEDAEKRQMQDDKAVTFWLDQLKGASYDMEDVLEEWTTARLKLQIEGLDDDNTLALPAHKKKVCSFFPSASNCFGSFKKLSLRHDIAVKIREINKTLDDITSQKDRFKFAENVSNNVKKPERVGTTSLVDEGEVCGRVDEKNELCKLLCESSEQQQGFHVISLVGLGGIGKTTLAQLAYNNNDVKRNFEKVIWVCVSDTFEEIRVAKAIIEGLGESTPSLSEFQSLTSHIHRSIEGKKFFLILDDVWDGNYNKWEPFFLSLKNGRQGSKILVTTRNESVARMMGSTNVMFIEQLAEEECWSLFKRLAFSGRSFEDCEKLEPIGRKIARKCKGLPLAAKVIGNLLRSKITVKEWQRILESEMWKVEEIGQGLLAPLLLSYNDLPSNYMVKRCFSYCAVFPKDYNMYKEELISLWMAQGYLNADEDEEMEMIGEEYFNILATRSFFQEFEKYYDDDDIRSCKMHDIVHDFAQFVSSKECINDTKESVINSFGDKVRHLGLKFVEDASFPMSIHRLNRLRTLLIYDESPYNRPLSSSILSELFSKLACLRALVIRQYNNLGIERLPKTLCELYNLQKLDIRGCEYLRELPAGIGKLMNMRTLLNYGTSSLEYMPIGISRLTNLRTLEKFVVGGGVDGGSTCRLESLKNLQLLRKCGVEGLSNVSHVDEAERLQLYNKKNLLRLLLVFGRVADGEGEEGRRKNEKDKQLLEALQPPCEHLPPLGKLPLEKLEIIHLKSVKRVGNEFLGIEESSEDEPSSSSASSSVTAFTKLKSLNIWDMEELEEWNYRITRKENISIMPRLSSLTVGSCNKLKALPDYLLQTTALQKLNINCCENLEELPILEDHRTTSVVCSLMILDCPKIKVLPDYLLRTTTLQCEHLPPLGKLPLEKLVIIHLKSVKRVGNEFLGIEESSEDGPSSSSSPPSVIAFPKLKSLIIGAMEELEEWNYRITRRENISIMPRLSSLEVRSCNKLKALPDYLLRTSTLQELTIDKCPLLENRYREGKGEDWHKISRIPHIKWSR